MNFLRHHIIIIAVAAIASIGIIFYAVWGISKPNNFAGISVSRMTLQEEVGGDGTVKAAEAVDLAFEQSGKINQVYVQVGDKVKIGHPIVSLDTSVLEAQLAEAQADINTQQAKLDGLKRGARPEDIETQNIAISNAEVTVKDAQDNLINVLQDAYTKSDDAIRNQVDQFISNPTTQNPVFLFTVNDLQLNNNAIWERTALESTMASWRSMNSNLTVNSNLDSVVTQTNSDLSDVKKFLDDVASIVNSLIPNSNLSQATITAYKTSVNISRINVGAAVSSLTAAQGLLNSANANLALAEQRLIVEESGAAPEDIAAQQAQLAHSMAAADLIKSQLAKSVLRSPIDGVISRQDGRVGAIASLNQPIASVISDSKYQIEIYVSEADVAKIKPGQSALVTLDAYGKNEEFDASVIAVDPAAVLMNGINAYKITLQFNKEDDRIKAGMSANVEIMTILRENVITVPKSAIMMRGNDNMVITEGNGGVAEERKVEIGVTGSNGYVEIISGLSEGDLITSFGSIN